MITYADILRYLEVDMNIDPFMIVEMRDKNVTEDNLFWKIVFVFIRVCVWVILSCAVWSCCWGIYTTK